MKDELGDRMKGFYENRYRIKLPRRTYTIIRIDGKAFHTYTRGLERPFDQGFIEDMNKTAAYLCKNITGTKLAYVQSDEISIIITDFDSRTTQAWFDNNLQKMTSVAASMATNEFNRRRYSRALRAAAIPDNATMKPSFNWTEIEEILANGAEFDSRVFQIHSEIEVENYLISRQQDATRNSISSTAQSLYSHKELNGKKSDEMQEMIFKKGINWDEYPPRKKRGAIIKKNTIKHITDFEMTSVSAMPDGSIEPNGLIKSSYTRTYWEEDQETPVFTKDRAYLEGLLNPEKDMVDDNDKLYGSFNSNDFKLS